MLKSCRGYFGYTRAPFTLTVAGQKFFVLTSTKDMSIAYKNADTLTFDGFIKDLYTSFGMSKEGIQKMWQSPSSELPKATSREYHLGQGIHREQLHHGDHLEDLTEVFSKEIERSVAWENIPGTSPAQMNKVLPLQDWCAMVLGNATIQAFFGDALLKLEPRLLEYFYAFDSESWKLIFKLPPIFASRMHAAKGKSKDAYLRYVKLPMDKRPGICYYLRTIEAKQREAGMNDRDIAIATQMFFWG